MDAGRGAAAETNERCGQQLERDRKGTDAIMLGVWKAPAQQELKASKY
jgi:hypothetical protein